MGDNVLETKYKIGKKLGQGAYGSVFLITNKENKKNYAIKQISKKKIVGDEYLSGCLKKELELMRKMNHKHSVGLLDFFETEENYNLILELCDTDLDEVLKRKNKGFNELELQIIMSQFNSVFSKMRQNQIIHRDLKLKNIMVKYDNTIPIIGFIIKLSDYGFSKELMENDLTSTRLGSPATQAPEIIYESYNAKVDLWSVGVIIYQLLYKQLPFFNVKTKKQLDLYKKKWVKVELPEKNDNPISDICFDLLDKLLKKDPNERIEFEDYFNHKFFSEEHKNELMKKYEHSNTKEKQTQKNNNDNTKSEKKPINMKIKIIEKNEFETKLKIINAIKEYDGFKLYKGKDLSSKINVLIKEISASKIENDDKNIHIFEKEIELLSQLKGDKFPKLYDSFKTNEYYYIIMEYFSGNILEDFINNHPNNLNNHLMACIFNQLTSAFSELKNNKINLDYITPKSFAFTFYQNENNFEIKFFDYGINSIFDKEKDKKYNSFKEKLLNFKFADSLKLNQDDKNCEIIVNKQEPMIKDDDFDNFLEIIYKKIDFIYNYYTNLFDGKDNIIENEMYSYFNNEIILLLYFCSLECQLLIKLLNINADMDISLIDEVEPEIHLFQFDNNKDINFNYSFINLLDESNESKNNNKYIYNKENPSFHIYLTKFKDLKKKIDIIFNKFIANNNDIILEKNIQNKSNNEDNELFFISISELLNSEDNDTYHQNNIIKQLLEKSIKEGNLEKYFMTICQNSILLFTPGEKQKKNEVLFFIKYILEYILLLKAISLNNDDCIKYEELSKLINKDDSNYFISFIGGVIKQLDKENYFNNSNNDKEELNKKIFEKMNIFYGKIIKLIK